MSDSDERERSSSPPRLTLYPGALPITPLQTKGYEESQSQHFTLFLSLAAHIRDKVIETAEPAFGNFLRNVRDHDIAIFTPATLFIGRGASFSVRRTLISEHRDVVFKSTLRSLGSTDKRDEARRLEAILLELRVLTHPPLSAHENIVNLLQLGWEGDTVDISRKWPVLVMEYADLGTLADYFDREPQLPWPVRKTLCEDVSRGLLALHQCGIVHGDLKLENSLVFSTNEEGIPCKVKLSDFGGALLDNDALESIPMATPPWNAPGWNVKGPRSQLISSDIYSLGLLMWRIVLNGKNPFDDRELFPACLTRAEHFARLDVEKTMDSFFLDKAKQSLAKWGVGLDQELMSNVFSASIRSSVADRDLELVVNLFGFSSQSNSTDVRSSEKAREEIMKQNDIVNFSFAGLDFTGVRAPLRRKVLESINIVLAGNNIDQKIEAAFALAMTNLASDDFGLAMDIDHGLQSLIIAADLGAVPYQALVLRFHEAFGRQVPESVKDKIEGWLCAAAATGSLTALEDLRVHGYTDSAKKSLRILQTRYCGIGEEFFKYDEEADRILQSLNETEVLGYIEKEMKIGQDAGKDISGYLLRIAASYGNALAIRILASYASADVNDLNGMNEGPLLFAARSGHLEALLELLRHGANPEIKNHTGDTPFHWLCSFPDDTVHQAGSALVSARADINARANIFPDDDGLAYAEMDYIAGTPLHRAIARGNSLAVKALLDLGADPHAPADDIDLTPFALSVLLHYPEIINIFLSRADGDLSTWLLLPSGKSILTYAMSGGTLYQSSIGRLVRHGHHQVSRAEETLAILLQAGASPHIHDLPGMSGCTAAFYAAQCHVSILNFLLRNGALVDVDKSSERPPIGEEEDMSRPPLFEAVIFGKLQNIHALLDAGADVNVVMSLEKQLSILHCCAEHGFEDLPTIDRFLQQGVEVDKAPLDFQTPFAYAVINRCFKLGDLLRRKGADPNALYRQSLFRSATYHSTLLGFLVIENSHCSISCIDFLLRKDPDYIPVNFIVKPILNHTVYHELALLPGDSQDPVATSIALSVCGAYFNPTLQDLNQVTACRPDSDGSVESEGGNTALHLAVIYANFEVVKWLLLSVEGVSTSIRNASGFTAIDLAALSYPKFLLDFVPFNIPKHPKRQAREAELRREAIWTLLKRYSPHGVTEGVTESFTLEEDADFDELEVDMDMVVDKNHISKC